MKKIIGVILGLVLILCMFTGCSEQREFYNQKDKSDFSSGAVIKFKIVQFKDTLDEKTLKEMNLSGGFFICAGGITAQSRETSEIKNDYYMYVMNKDGGIYFAHIPSSKVRIYEDSKVPYLVANRLDGSFGGLDSEQEHDWEGYDEFNLHLPKGTVIPRINYNFNVENIKK